MLSRTPFRSAETIIAPSLRLRRDVNNVFVQFYPVLREARPVSAQKNYQVGAIRESPIDSIYGDDFGSVRVNNEPHSEKRFDQGKTGWPLTHSREVSSV